MGLLSSKLALVPAGGGPGQSGGWASCPPIGRLSGHIGCLLIARGRRAITHMGRNRSSGGHFVHCTFFTWRSICIKILIPREVSLWPSVTFSHLEIVLFCLKKKSFIRIGARVVIICHLSKKSPCQAIYMLIACGLGRKRMLPAS